MSRVLRLAGAQMGANQKADSREAILARMVALLEQAAAAGASCRDAENRTGPRAREAAGR